MNEQNETPLDVQTYQPPTNTDPMLALVERAARDSTVDVQKMEKLLAMAERIQSRKAESEYDAAMNRAQAEMRPVANDSDNPQTRSRYASYGALDRAVRPIYTEHGFSLSFGTRSPNPDRVTVTCRVSHRAGHTERVEIEMPADGKGAKGGDVMTKTHATGSAVSYGMRYLLKMIFNIAVGEYDDDGNAAGKAPAPTPPQKTAPAPTPPVTKPETKPAKPWDRLAKMLEDSKRKLIGYSTTAPWAWWKACVDLGLLPQVNNLNEAPATELFPVDMSKDWEENQPAVKAQFERIQAKQEEIVAQCAKNPLLQAQIEMYYAAASSTPPPPKSQAAAAAKAKAPTPLETMEQDEPWRAVEIPFGKNKGLALGEIPKSTLFGWWANWRPKEYKGQISDADAVLRQALDDAGEHYQFTKPD